MFVLAFAGELKGKKKGTTSYCVLPSHLSLLPWSAVTMQLSIQHFQFVLIMSGTKWDPFPIRSSPFLGPVFPLLQ